MVVVAVVRGGRCCCNIPGAVGAWSRHSSNDAILLGLEPLQRHNTLGTQLDMLLTLQLIHQSEQNVPIPFLHWILQQCSQSLLGILNMRLVITSDTITKFLVIESWRDDPITCTILGAFCLEGPILSIVSLEREGDWIEHVSTGESLLKHEANETIVELLLPLGLRTIFTGK